MPSKINIKTGRYFVKDNVKRKFGNLLINHAQKNWNYFADCLDNRLCRISPKKQRHT